MLNYLVTRLIRINNNILVNIKYNNIINPLTSPGEGVSVFTSPYLSAGDPELGETKGLILSNLNNSIISLNNIVFVKFLYSFFFNSLLNF